MTLTQRL